MLSPGADPGLMELKEVASARRFLGKRCLFCYTLLGVSVGDGKQHAKYRCNKKACRTEYDSAVHRDYRRDVYQLLTPREKRNGTHR